MKKIDFSLSEEQKQYVRDNRKKYNIITMAKAIDTPYNRIQKYMRLNGLSLTDKEVNEMRANTLANMKRGKYKQPKPKIVLTRKESMKAHMSDSLE